MSHCRDWNEHVGAFIRNPEDLRAFLDDIREMRDSGAVEIVYASRRLEEYSRDAPLPDDMHSWTFRCRESGKVFKLGIDSYHGRVGWEMVPEPVDGFPNVMIPEASNVIIDAVHLPEWATDPSAIGLAAKSVRLVGVFATHDQAMSAAFGIAKDDRSV